MDKETYVKRMAELAEIKQKALEYDRKEREKARKDRSYQGRTQRQFFV